MIANIFIFYLQVQEIINPKILIISIMKHLKPLKLSILEYIFSNYAILFKNAYYYSQIQLKERIITKRRIEEMFSADYFNFYSNFWNTGETIGLSGGDTKCIIKKEEKIGCISMIDTSEFSKIKFFEITIDDFVK